MDKHQITLLYIEIFFLTLPLEAGLWSGPLRFTSLFCFTFSLPLHCQGLLVEVLVYFVDLMLFDLGKVNESCRPLGKSIRSPLFSEKILYKSSGFALVVAFLLCYKKFFKTPKP